MPNDTVPDTLSCENRLCKTKPRLLMLLPGLTMGGSDKFNLDLLQQLTTRGWEISIATTLPGDDTWLPLFARHTPDIFVLEHFLRLVDYPRFLRYLIQSRQVDTVMVSHNELGYLLLSYLRAHCPHVTFVDLSHSDIEWENGLYAKMAVEYQELLDLSIVSSQQLKRSMVQQGADSDRIAVYEASAGPDEQNIGPDAGKSFGALLAEAAAMRDTKRRLQKIVALRASASYAVEYLRLAWESERKIKEQQSRIAELERSKAWLEEERGNWQRIAEEREAWIAELERAKAWLEEQRGNWQRLAEQRERMIQQQHAAWQASRWMRLGVRLRLAQASPMLYAQQKKRVNNDDD